MSASSLDYEGQLTVDDFVAGYLAFARRARHSRFNQIYSWAFWILVCLMFVLAEGWLRAVALALGVWVFVVDAVNKREASENARHLFNTHPALQCKFHSRFDAEGFRTKGEVFEDFRSWKAFRAWEEIPDHVLVHESDRGIGRIIPKRLFSDPADLEALREILATHLPQIGGSAGA